jgi:hypothetical protein
MGDRVEHELTPSLKAVSSFVAWIVASVSGIGMVLTAFGFVVHHAYLGSLGVPRSVYEAKASEYFIMGGNFLLGLLPMAVVGLLNLLVHAWWLLLMVAALVGLWRWRRWSARRRLLAAALLYGAWLGIVMIYFTDDAYRRVALAAAKPDEVVAMLTATTLLSAGYLTAELTAERHQVATGGRASRDWLPLAVLLSCGFVVLPYLRGAHAILVSHPFVEPLGPERPFFDALAGPRPSGCTVYNACPDWRLVEIGASRVILRSVRDGSIVVLPSEKLTNFRILPAVKQP